MKDFLLVFKTIYKNSHSSQIGINGKKRMSSSLTFVLSTLPLILMVCAFLAFFTISIKDIRLLSAMVALVISGAQIMVLFLSLGSILNTLYASSDTAMLNTLPISPVSIFFAKLANVYLSCLELVASIIVPALLTVTITFNVVNGSIFYGIYPFIFLIFLLTPVLPLFVIVLFSMPINYIGSFFKGNSTAKSIFSLLFYVVLICLYMVFIFYINTSGFGQNGETGITETTASSLLLISKIMYPNYVMANFALGIEFGKNFGISLAITTAIMLLLIVLSRLFYKKINEKHLESYASQTVSQSSSYKQQSIVASLMIRDCKLIIRNSYVTLQSLANLILGPILVVVMYFINSNKETPGMSSGMNEMMQIGFLVMYGLIFVCGTNMLAMIAYTREGESFTITKTLPISAKDSITAKVLLAVIAGGIVGLIMAVIGIFLYKIDVVSALVFFICIILCSLGSSCLLVYFDMKFGSTHWKTNADLKQASSNNRASILGVMMSMIPGILMFGLGFLLSAFETTLGGIIIVKIIYWVIAFAISLMVALIGFTVLKKKGEAAFEIIGENSFKKKEKKQNVQTLMR